MNETDLITLHINRKFLLRCLAVLAVCVGYRVGYYYGGKHMLEMAIQYLSQQEAPNARPSRIQDPSI